MSLRVAAIGLTDIGRVRTRNEDAFHIHPEGGIAVVADGMGGAPAGDVASRLTVDAVADYLRGARWEGCPVIPDEAADPAGAVREAVRCANQRVFEAAEKNPAKRGMGCTVTALYLDRTTGAFGIGHVGDSRAYRLRGSTLERLTVDHTVAQESVDEGHITQEAARDHPYGHVLTRVVGTEADVEPLIVRGRAEPGDIFLLCTDGLVRVVEDDEVRAVLSGGRGLKAASEALVAAVHERGAPDNATLILLALESEVAVLNG